MPTITNKAPLGNLFGGKIASINYNFQTASQPSTATITVVNENNTFLKPSFNELISIPPFGFQMLVVERGTRKDTNYDILQVELVESISQILDKELVLVFGEHTDLQYNLNNDFYYVTASSFIPKSFYPAGVSFNPNISFPQFQENYIKNHGDGINVIGTARVTYFQEGSENITGSETIKGEPYWITFENGKIKESISSYEDAFVYSADTAGDLNIVYGYTLKNLFLLFQSKGLSFDSKSESLMQDENIFFSDAGSFREVLAGCLAKIGRSFYIDPFTQKIVIITNSDVARINNNLLQKFSNFNVAGATQISLKESISDVDATHFVVKGDLEFIDDSDSPQKEPRKRKQVLYKLEADSLAGDLEPSDISLLKRIAPLVFNISEESALNKYLFALGFQYETTNWGDLYGIKNYYSGPFEPIVKANPHQNVINPPNIPDWQKAIQKAITLGPTLLEDLNGYKPHLTIGARPLYRDNESSEIPAQSGSDVDYFQSVRWFSQLWAGIYFSAPMSKTEIDRRQYDDMSTWEGGLDNSFAYEKVKGDTPITQVDPLQFLVGLLKRIGANTNYTVAQIAQKALNFQGSTQSDIEVLGEGDYYLIATRKLFSGAEIQTDELLKLINENFYEFSIPISNKRYILYNKSGQDVLRSVEQACLAAFEKETLKVKKRLVASYIKVIPDKDPSESSGQEDIFDIPKLFSLRNIKSNIENFGTRSLTVIQNRYSEMKLFLENIQDLNPQFSGPLISTQIDYFRPPLKSDFDIESGVDSINISIGDGGVTTSISYSSKKFAQIDLAVMKETLGGGTAGFFKRLTTPAFRRNQLRQ